MRPPTKLRQVLSVAPGRVVVVVNSEQILAGLDPEQKAIAQAVDGPVVVIAGAGTGKTRALTHRIAYGVATGAAPAQQSLALTFTTKAAGEMRHRLAALRVPGVQARTFHAAALRQAKFFWPQATHTDFPTVTSRSMPMVAEAASKLGVARDTARLRDLTAEISWAKSCNVSVEAYSDVAEAAGRFVNGVTPGQVADVLAAYELVKHRAGVIDMDDILLATLGLITQYPSVAEQVRDTYRYLFVDEYQDVSPLQHSLLKAWLGESDQIVAVGDAAQSIHSFAGADPKYLLGFTREFPRAQTFKLVRNYRSSATVVEYANALAARSRGQVPAVRLRPQCPPGPGVTKVACDGSDQEVAGTVEWLRACHETGLDWPEMAVLYRINSQSAPFEDALSDAGIPFTVRGGERMSERLAEEQPAPAGDGVVLATLHSTKGLEFQAVAIVGVQEGLLPYTLSTTPAQVAEEDRLLYVGVTRARQLLRISWDGSRRRPSRFLDATTTSRGGGRPKPREKRQLRKCRVCGEALLGGADIKLGRHSTCPSQYDEALLDALKAWRLKRAHADEVPAFVVFSDATLTAVAEAVPHTREALLDISGIGPSKSERYGDEVLAIITQHSSG